MDFLDSAIAKSALRKGGGPRRSHQPSRNHPAAGGDDAAGRENEDEDEDDEDVDVSEWEEKFCALSPESDPWMLQEKATQAAATTVTLDDANALPSTPMSQVTTQVASSASSLYSSLLSAATSPTTFSYSAATTPSKEEKFEGGRRRAVSASAVTTAPSPLSAPLSSLPQVLPPHHQDRSIVSKNAVQVRNWSEQKDLTFTCVRFGLKADRGPCHYMEDRIVALPRLTQLPLPTDHDHGHDRDDVNTAACSLALAVLNTGAFFGVYDGHGGSEACDQLEAELHLQVQANLSSLGFPPPSPLPSPSTPSSSPLSWPSSLSSSPLSGVSLPASSPPLPPPAFLQREEEEVEAWRCVEGALTEAFLAVDQAIVTKECARIAEERKASTSQAKRKSLQHAKASRSAGSTAIVVLLFRAPPTAAPAAPATDTTATATTVSSPLSSLQQTNSQREALPATANTDEEQPTTPQPSPPSPTLSLSQLYPSRVDGEGVDCGASGGGGGADGSLWLVCCNVGDCRAVLSRKGKVVKLSHDHKVTSRRERTRIEALGLKSDIRKDRLFGVLAVSRSFGDVALKTRQQSGSGSTASNGSGGSFGGGAAASAAAGSSDGSSGSGSGGSLVATPEILRVKVEACDEFVVVASDGLWDVLGSQRVVNFVRKRLAVHRCAQRVAGELVGEALALGGHDNTSALVIMLHQGENNDATTAAAAAAEASRSSEQRRHQHQQPFLVSESPISRSLSTVSNPLPVRSRKISL